MHTALCTAALVFSASLCGGHDFGQRTSVLRLEAGPGGKGTTPFHGGDNLEIHETQPGTATATVSGRRVTILDVQHWPWVLVHTPQGEAWVNFDHVSSARHAAPEK